jgi:class 3 adenylate cyclase
MRLRPKVFAIFGIALGLVALFGALTFPLVVNRVSKAQLFSLSRTLGSYLIHDLESLEFKGDHAAFEKSIDRQLEFVQSLGESSGNYSLKIAIIVSPDFKVEIGHPDSTLGADYSGHADIRAAMAGAPMTTVLEAADGGTGTATDADIVAPLKLADGDQRVLEVKLDLSRSLAMIEAQYATVRLLVIAFIGLGFLVVALVIADGLRRTILQPLLRVSGAMERVGSGDLEARVDLHSKDELGEMASRFDEMVRGLRERFQLERYVSRSTVGAARSRAESGGADAPVQRKRRTVFFSDVRGFTSFSESADPAHVVSVLNLLLGMQEEVITRAGGEVDKFVGDETMAVFERPAQAVAAALAIRARVARMAGEIDGLKLGYGIHEGELVEGDIGSPRMMDHTVIGDTVNTAARLQAAAKGHQIIISESVAANGEVAARFVLEAMDSLSVKGKSEPLRVFSVSSSKSALKHSLQRQHG